MIVAAAIVRLMATSAMVLMVRDLADRFGRHRRSGLGADVDPKLSFVARGGRVKLTRSKRISTGEPTVTMIHSSSHNQKAAIMTLSLQCVAFLLVAVTLPVTAAAAQTQIPADSDPARLANAQDAAGPQGDLQVRIGAGLLYGPAFLGSRDYQLRAGPNIEVRYKDRFFISVIDGVGFDLIKTDNLRAGPIVKYQQRRKENGSGPFVIAGDRSDALRGLGDVAATAEVGGYVSYRSGAFSAKAEVRKGIGGHDGLIAELGARYSTTVGGMKLGNRAVMVSIGPRATIADATYTQAYFGIDATQSAASGLAQFNAGGGLQSYGLGATIVVPVSGNLSAAALGGLDRLSGDAAKSPLVRDRGSRNQRTFGLGLTYRFGM